MLYPFMTLPDKTEIVHSESILSEGRELVKVCIEKPVDYGFQSATCWLPDYRWENVEGYSQEEITRLQEFIESLSAVIIELAREGGFKYAPAV